jgi:cytochrome c biogenesis protein CcmG/thiol:disulfide interchange protein DsbE
MKRLSTFAMLLVASSLAFSPVVLAAVGTRAQEFSLPAAPGGTSRGRFRLADHLGQRPVVILFWATWCQPCQVELPVYQQLYQRYGADRITVVAIAMDNPDTISEVGPTARSLGLTFPVVTDLETQVVAMYNPRRAAPFSVWIDRTGTIVREREGFAMSERPNIEQGIARLVAGVRVSN